MPYRYLSLLLCLLLQACIGCRSELALLELLDTRPAHVVIDTTQREPDVRYKRPAYAQSLPSGYDYDAQTPPSPLPKKRGVLGWLKPATPATTRIKNKGTIILQNGNQNDAAPKTTGTTKLSAGAAQASEQGTATGAAKRKQPVITKTITKTTPWYVFALLAVGCVYLGAKFNTRLRWLPGVAVVLLCLASPPAQAQKQLVIPTSRYSYHEQRAAERRYKRTKRYYKRKSKRDDREAAADRRRKQKQADQDLRRDAAEHRRRLQLVREVTVHHGK